MSDALIDLETWETMKSMGDRDFLVEMINLFNSDTPDLIAQMQSGLAAGDIETVRRAAHSLKSNAASFGAGRLSAAARELEMLARSGSFDGAAFRLAAVEAEYRLLAPRLEELKNEC